MSRASLEEVFHHAIDVVESGRIAYFVYGGLAVPAWGRLRNTDDVDLVVRVEEPGWERLFAALREAGFHLPDSARTLFFIDTWAKASWRGRDLDLALGATEFDLEALGRAVRLSVLSRVVPVATAEDLILYKLISYRHRDLADARDILIRQGEKLDREHLRQWAQRIAEATGKFEVSQTLEKMLAEQGL